MVSSEMDAAARLGGLRSTPAALTGWLRTRLRPIAIVWSLAALALYLADLSRQLQVGLTDGVSRPFGDDYVNYWSAAVLAWSGQAARVYDLAGFHEFQASVVGPTLQGYYYSYPPVLLLLTAPLALLPYVPGLFAWLGASWFAFYRTLRLATPKHALLLALACPAMLVNAVAGQNGAWTAALVGGGLALVDRRPMLAGGLFGLLIYKPHLGLMLPLALIAGRRWKALAAAAVVAGALVVLSAGIFGSDVWKEYLHNTEMFRRSTLEGGEGVWHRMVSVFVFARRLGFDVFDAYALQAAAGICGALLVIVAWYRDLDSSVRNSVVVVATLVAVPYIQDYDLVVCTFVAAWIMAANPERRTEGSSAFIPVALLLVLPLVAAPFGATTGFAIGPALIFPMFGWLAVSVMKAPRQEPRPC
jgi:hypothetical protein